MKWKLQPVKSKNIVEQLLLNRGLKTKLARENFFNPKLDDFKKDLDMKNIDIAKKRILKAIKKEELIFVSGDFDADGICGAAVLYLGLSSIAAKVLPYIPHREKEGYGLSKVGLEYAKEKGAGLVISVDCGIVDFEEGLYAKKLGLDLIITDHHQPLAKRPKSFTIVHSTKMCGTAVAWCLVKSLVAPEQAAELLDLVAIATVADMMPMLDLNRAFVKVGLLKLNSTKRVGLLALVDEAGTSLGEIGSYEIGHIIAPRLNATGRLESAMYSLRLVCTKNKLRAMELAKKLGQVNNQRKLLTTQALEMARLKIVENKKIHVLWDESWKAGIVGLVAGRVSEETGKPAIAISVGAEESRGSARSNGGLNIVEIIRECADLLVAVGGHPGAAGFTIKSSRIIEFQKRLEALVDGVAQEEKALQAEAKVKKSEISLELAKKLTEFEPFGLGNQKPVFVTDGLSLTDLKTVGSGKHLKGLADGINFIAFNKGELKDLLKEGTVVDLAYNLEIDKFGGKLQLVVKDLKL